MTENIEIQTVRTDHFSMDYFRFGHGKETLVILPGLSVQSVMNSADIVANAYRTLTDDFTIYVFERRNELPAAYTVFQMASDTAEVMRALHLKETCIFGASQGGMMAMAIAARHPELVRKMALGSTTACVTDEIYGTIGRWAALAKAQDVEALYQAFGEAIYPKETYEQYRKALSMLARNVTKEELDRFVILAESMKGFDMTGALDRIACPVLVIGVKNDQVVGAGASLEIAGRLKNHPGCEIYLYDDYGHAAYDLAPDYKERLLRFFKSHPDGSAPDLNICL